MMKIVVTGSSGFLGRYVMRAITAFSDAEAVGVSRRAVPGSIAVEDYRATPGGDVLIHLAEDSDRARVARAEPEYEETTRRTLRRLLANGYQRVVFASSAALYGDADERPRVPDDPVVLEDRYVRAKRRAEVDVLQSPGGVVARIANAYGKGMSPNGVIGTVLGQIPATGPLRVRDTSPVRDFIWAEDAALALVNLAVHENVSPPCVFNVGTSVGTSIGDVARMALDIAGQPDRPVESEGSSGARSVLVLDVAGLKEVCGWTPEVNLKQGLTCLIAGKQKIA